MKQTSNRTKVPKVVKLNEMLTTEFKSDNTFTQLWVSDLHLDSPYTDKKKVKKLFDKALENGWQINILGDTFDIMGGKYDKRTIKGDIKVEHSVDNYLMAVTRDIAQFLAPYIDNIGFISSGNHEKEIDKRIELYMLELLDLCMYELTHKHINWTKEYAGFMRITGARDVCKVPVEVFWEHGRDGNASMSLGALNVKRRAATITADIFISGHIHRNLSVPLNRIYLSKNGYVKVREQLHIQLGTGKESKSVDYFSARKGFDPASTSMYTITYKYVRTYSGNKEDQYIDFIENRIKL
ncbi:MAG: hypothetical protein ACK566_06265 [Bacteroidota bacterium]|jgi:UDP-2,3-diacylglucosamine pyrophosphatase LpxH